MTEKRAVNVRNGKNELVCQLSELPEIWQNLKVEKWAHNLAHCKHFFKTEKAWQQYLVKANQEFIHDYC